MVLLVLVFRSDFLFPREGEFSRRRKFPLGNFCEKGQERPVFSYDNFREQGKGASALSATNLSINFT